jgi:hypothetical protein
MVVRKSPTKAKLVKIINKGTIFYTDVAPNLTTIYFTVDAGDAKTLSIYLPLKCNFFQKCNNISNTTILSKTTKLL